MKTNVYLFETYCHGYDVGATEYIECMGQTIEQAREALLGQFPDAYILNEYIKLES